MRFPLDLGTRKPGGRGRPNGGAGKNNRVSAPLPCPGRKIAFPNALAPSALRRRPRPRRATQALSRAPTALGDRDAACRLCSAAGGAVRPSRTGSRFWFRSTHTECYYPWSSRTHSGFKVRERLLQAGREPEGASTWRGGWCTPPAEPGFVLY